MNKKVILFYLIVNILVYGAPLESMADRELDKSEDLLDAEIIRENHMPLYVKLVKSRYLLTKKIPFLSKKNKDIVILNSIINNIKVTGEK